jgi:hypothetical protein
VCRDPNLGSVGTTLERIDPLLAPQSSSSGSRALRSFLGFGLVMAASAIAATEANVDHT